MYVKYVVMFTREIPHLKNALSARLPLRNSPFSPAKRPGLRSMW